MWPIDLGHVDPGGCATVAHEKGGPVWPSLFQHFLFGVGHVDPWSSLSADSPTMSL